MPLSQQAKIDVLSWLLGLSPVPVQPVLPLKLGVVILNGSPTTPGTEPSESLYARQPFTMPSAGSGSNTQSAPLGFGAVASSQITLRGYEAWDSSATPRRIWWAQFAGPVTLAANDVVDVSQVFMASSSLFASFPTVVERLMLDWLNGKAVSAPQGPFNLRLITNNPGDRNVAGTEVVGDLYQRKTLTFGAPEITPLVNNSSVSVPFGPQRWPAGLSSSGPGEPVYGYEIWSANGIRILTCISQALAVYENSTSTIVKGAPAFANIPFGLGAGAVTIQ